MNIIVQHRAFSGPNYYPNPRAAASENCVREPRCKGIFAQSAMLPGTFTPSGHEKRSRVAVDQTWHDYTNSGIGGTRHVVTNSLSDVFIFVGTNG